MTSTPLNVVISGAAGQIAYSLIPLVCGGHVFGAEQRLNLRLLDIVPAAEALEGVKMEIQDCGYHLLDSVLCTTDLKPAFENVHIAILVGGFPRGKGMERKDLISKNVTIFKAQGEAIESYANHDIKVLVVANPANTNCLIAMKHAPSIPKENFSALTRLDHERLRAFLVEKINRDSEQKINAKDVHQCIIWGNHSSTQVPDSSQVTVGSSSINRKSLYSFITDTQWLNGELMHNVQQRGAHIIKARKLSSAMSAAAAIGSHLKDWLYGNPTEYVSMGVISNGNPYNVPNDLIYSFPVKCLGNGKYEIVQDIPITEKIASMMSESSEELLSEKDDAIAILGSNL